MLTYGGIEDGLIIEPAETVCSRKLEHSKALGLEPLMARRQLFSLQPAPYSREEAKTELVKLKKT
jgi:hypothetical protein